MRYFVLLYREADQRPYIVAETVRDSDDEAADRALSLAGGVGGPSAGIVTEEELQADPAGRAALESWRNTDDRTYSAESLLLEARTDEGPVRLRLVRATDDLAAVVEPIDDSTERRDRHRS